MKHDSDSQLEYWNRPDVESMYDKNLLNAEISLIRARIPPGTKILDAGCGEGEGTLVYASIPGTTIHGVDFSETRLELAQQRLASCENVTLSQVDFLGEYRLDTDYDIVVSQRFLINLLEWDLQSRVLRDLMTLLKPGGRLLMLEGSQEGVDSLNNFRAAWGLDPIPVKWHNLFFDDFQLVSFLTSEGHTLLEQAGLGAYFMLTRGVRPTLDGDLFWDCDFNRLAATHRMDELLQLGERFSRLKLWVFEKQRSTKSGRKSCQDEGPIG
jgi:ubiquinone/menaquinone biosynthesis C-methylase UbiE